MSFSIRFHFFFDFFCNFYYTLFYMIQGTKADNNVCFHTNCYLSACPGIFYIRKSKMLFWTDKYINERNCFRYGLQFDPWSFLSRQNLNKKIMHTISHKKTIATEERHIALHIGILTARCILLCLLFILTIPLLILFKTSNTSLYLFIILLLCPPICSGTLNGKIKKEHMLLNTGASHFLYSAHHYMAEKYCCVLTFTLLVTWQYSLLRSQSHLFVKLLPAFCIIVYLVVFAAGYFITKKHIRSYYTQLTILE